MLLKFLKGICLKNIEISLQPKLCPFLFLLVNEKKAFQELGGFGLRIKGAGKLFDL